LEQYGLAWIHPTLPLAHPLDDGTAAALERSVEATGATLGCDAGAYRKLMEPLASNWDNMADAVLGPLRIPHHPFALARFGLSAMCSAQSLVEHTFKGEHARAFFAGMAAHSIQALEQPLTASFGLVLAILGHAVGWPLPRGGSQKI